MPGSSWSLALHLFQQMLRKEHSLQNVSWIRSALLQVLANAPGKGAGAVVRLKKRRESFAPVVFSKRRMTRPCFDFYFFRHTKEQTSGV